MAARARFVDDVQPRAFAHQAAQRFGYRLQAAAHSAQVLGLGLARGRASGNASSADRPMAPRTSCAQSTLVLEASRLKLPSHPF